MLFYVQTELRPAKMSVFCWYKVLFESGTDAEACSHLARITITCQCLLTIAFVLMLWWTRLGMSMQKCMLCTVAFVQGPQVRDCHKVALHVIALC